MEENNFRKQEAYFQQQATNKVRQNLELLLNDYRENGTKEFNNKFLYLSVPSQSLMPEQDDKIFFSTKSSAVQLTTNQGSDKLNTWDTELKIQGLGFTNTVSDFGGSNPGHHQLDSTEILEGSLEEVFVQHADFHADTYDPLGQLVNAKSKGVKNQKRDPIAYQLLLETLFDKAWQKLTQSLSKTVQNIISSSDNSPVSQKLEKHDLSITSLLTGTTNTQISKRPSQQLFPSKSPQHSQEFQSIFQSESPPQPLHNSSGDLRRHKRPLRKTTYSPRKHPRKKNRSPYRLPPINQLETVELACIGKRIQNSEALRKNSPIFQIRSPIPPANVSTYDIGFLSCESRSRRGQRQKEDGMFKTPIFTRRHHNYVLTIRKNSKVGKKKHRSFVVRQCISRKRDSMM